MSCYALGQGFEGNKLGCATLCLSGDVSPSKVEEWIQQLEVVVQLLRICCDIRRDNSPAYERIFELPCP